MLRRSVICFGLVILILLLVGISNPVYAEDASPGPGFQNSTPIGSDILTTTTNPFGGISFPENGAILKGVVAISGDSLSAWVLSFSYADDPTGTRFILAQSTEPISAGTFATWDTTSLTDGFYVLHLRILVTDGAQEMKVNIGIRNNNVTESASPSEMVTEISTLTATISPASNPGKKDIVPAFLSTAIVTSSPQNLAVLDQKDILNFLGIGIFAVLMIFIFLGAIIGWRGK